MPGKIAGELKQTRPMPPEAEAFFNLRRTADFLVGLVAEALKPADLSPTQYNVLRILRGAGKEGRTCGEIGDRLVARDPDITRLLDRLEKRSLIARSRESKDRRVITVRITSAGLQTLRQLEKAVEEAIRLPLSRLGNGRLSTLIQLLEEIRTPEN